MELSAFIYSFLFFAPHVREVVQQVSVCCKHFKLHKLSISPERPKKEMLQNIRLYG